MTQLLLFPYHPSQGAPEELSAALPPRGAQQALKGKSKLVESEVQKANAPLRPSACVTSHPAASCIDEGWDVQSPEPSQTPRVLQPLSLEGG